MVKILRKSYENDEAQFPHFRVFIGQESIFRRYCIQNVEDGIQTQVYNINDKSINHFSQFISEKVKKHLRKSLAQFWEKLRKLRLRQKKRNSYKKRVIKIDFCKATLGGESNSTYPRLQQVMAFH